MAEDDDEGLKSVFKTYDKDNSGHIDAKELREMLTDLEFEIPSEDYFTRLVQKLDESGDGLISFDEFLLLIEAVRERAKTRNQDELMEMFQGYDADGSGDLSIPEVTFVIRVSSLRATPQNTKKRVTSVKI